MEISDISNIQQLDGNDETPDKIIILDNESHKNIVISPIQQLDGNDEIPEKIKFHGLAGVISDGVVIPFLVNFFRSLEHNWNQFETHTLCTKPKCSSNSRCLLCHLRSITLRLNRVRYKRKMKPMELEAQIDKLPSEKKFQETFPSELKNIMENISSFEPSFRNSFLGGDMECAN